MKLKLGTAIGLPVYMNTENQLNGSMAFFGVSGSGKTVLAQKVMTQIVSHGGTVVALDFHGNLTNDQIFEECKATINRFRNDVYADENGMPCDLFEALQLSNGRNETESEVIGSIVNTLGMAYGLGIQQKRALKTAVTTVFNDKEYVAKDISAIGEVLKKCDEPHAKSAYERMETLFDRNLFVSGDGMIIPNKINFIHLSCGMDTSLQDAAVGLLLAWFWRRGSAGLHRNNPIYVFVDECQNIRHGPKDALSMLLSEGRKMGINLLLATQDIKDCSPAIEARITQCAVMAYFKPKSDAIYRTAKMISPSEYKSWIPELEKLRRGEFIATGNLLVGNVEYDHPVRVTG